MSTNSNGDILPDIIDPTGQQPIQEIAQAVADVTYHAGVKFGADAVAEAFGYYLNETAKAYAQAGADALYRFLQETGALAAADRVTIREVIRDKEGRITASVERTVSEADLAGYGQ